MKIFTKKKRNSFQEKSKRSKEINNTSSSACIVALQRVKIRGTNGE